MGACGGHVRPPRPPSPRGSLLVPLSIPATLVAVYLNWLSMKFFRHN